MQRLDDVQALDYASAGRSALVLVLFAFAVLAGVGIAWLPIWLIAAREGPLQARAAASGEYVQGAGGNLMPLLQLLTQRTFLGVLACGYVSFSVLALVVAWLPPFGAAKAAAIGSICAITEP